MKKTIFALIVLVLIAAAIIFLKGEPRPANQLRIGYSPQSLIHSAIIVALEKGYFLDHGLEVETLPLSSGSDIRLALISGHIDVGSAGMADMIPIIARGVPVKVITSMSVSPTYVFIRPDSGLRTFEDLYGKNVLVSPGGSNDLAFRAAMNKEGIDVDKMKFIDVDQVNRVATLMGLKLADAAVFSGEDLGNFVKAGGVVLPEWKEKGYLDFLYPRASILTSVQFLADHEDLFEKFLDAYGDAQRLIQNDPQEAAVVTAKHILEHTEKAVDYSPEFIVGEWQNGIRMTVWQDPATGMKMAEESRRLGILDRDLAVEDIYDLRFAEKLSKLQEDIYGSKN